MSLTPCKECAGAVSSSAKNCPQCGAPVPQKTKKLHLVFAGVILLVVMLSILDRQDKESPVPAVASHEQREASGKVMTAQIMVKATLKDPDSADFGVSFFRAGAVCGSVNAKNSFGAMTGQKRFVVLFDPPLVSIEGSQNDWSSLWQSKCN